MIKRTLYFGNPAYLSTANEQLVIKLPEVETNDSLPESFKKETVRTVPIEDIGVVVLDNSRITISHGVLDKLLANNSAVITCNASHLPYGLLLPLDGNTTQNERYRYQLEASVPLCKQLWKQTIEQKILNQAKVLEKVLGEPAKNMLVWATDVRSGDSENKEARAAAYYWKTIFPNLPNFVRGQEGDPPNNLLNYGYAILRAVVARSLVISGLLPTLGIHHHNRYNAYCLADDVMEPYRPYVDAVVIDLMKNYAIEEISQEVKIVLLKIPDKEVMIGGKKTKLMVAVSQTTASLYKCFTGELRKILYPEME